MGVIYMLYNQEGNAYIGQTIDIGKRLRNHRNKRTNTTASKLLGNWNCEILEECDDECLVDYERYWYDFYNELFPNMIVNIDTPLQTLKEWREKNKQNLIIKNTKWNRENKERRQEKIECECGGKYMKHNKLRHLKTTLHLNSLQTV
jgi:predicted GIY-YIG superfamily endonuclease